MLRAYADTSVLFAYFHPADAFAPLVTRKVREVMPDFVYWAFLRYELRHNLRQRRTDSYGELAWSALRASEATSARLRWAKELTADRLLESAEELSANQVVNFACGAMDFIHVAAAKRLLNTEDVDEFWTCDGTQAALAKAVGLKTRLFELEHPASETPA